MVNVKYELYQAKIENDIVFMPYCWVESRNKTSLINKYNYDKVISNDSLIESWESFESIYDLLDELFVRYNEDSPRHFRSMSVSDVVVLHYYDNSNHKTKAFYCDSLGWKEISPDNFI